MKAFLKLLDDLVWKAAEKGWTPFVTTEDDGKVVLTVEDKWTEEYRKAEAGNAKATNAIFSAIDGKNFKMISTCEIAKMAWDIPQTARKGMTDGAYLYDSLSTTKLTN